MAKPTTLKGLVLAQYGSVIAYTDAYSKKFGRISYTAMRNRLDNSDAIRIDTVKKMLSLLDLSDLSNPYAFLFSN